VRCGHQQAAQPEGRPTGTGTGSGTGAGAVAAVGGRCHVALHAQLREQTVEPRRQPPVRAAEQRHRRRDEDHPHHRRVQRDGDREPEADHLHERVRVDHERQEDRHHDERAAGDDAAGRGQPARDRLGVVAGRDVRRLIGQFASQVAVDPGLAARLRELTARERDVVVAVARGRSNAEIAGELCIGPATVKSHVSSVLTKLGLRDRAQIVVVAYEGGLVTPGA
jgi:DNA-binding CsgD family transcriptional regulator